MMKSLRFAGFLPLLSLVACDLAPHYERPAAPVPTTWPEGAAYPAATAAAPGLRWRALIGDERLRRLIETALGENRDLRQSVANIAAARAQYRIQRSSLLPTVTGGASAQINGARDGSINSYSTNVGFSAFEIDLFGRQRNLSRAAFENYLATESGTRSVRISLVAETANAWSTYAADLDLLAVARDTVVSASRTLQLTRDLDRAGLIGKLDVAQAETIVAQAESDVQVYTTRIAQDRNAIQLLVGAPVDEALLPRSLAEIEPSFALAPAGLSSEILLQRPDVLEQEHRLRAANANIGAARAAFLPVISLTSVVGFASTALSSLFSGGAFGWTVSPSATLPIFGGPVRGNLDYARSQRDFYLAGYEGAIQAAFRDVSNALARRGTIDAQRTAQRRLVNASRQTVTLATARYRAGIVSYLDTLLAERSFYLARQSEVNTLFEDISNRVALYSAIGADDPAQP